MSAKRETSFKDHCERGLSPRTHELMKKEFPLCAALCPAGAETIAAQYRPAFLWFEWHRVGLAALVANDFKSFPL
jgi:hypothetical protein